MTTKIIPALLAVPLCLFAFAPTARAEELGAREEENAFEEYLEEGAQLSVEACIRQCIAESAECNENQNGRGNKPPSRRETRACCAKECANPENRTKSETIK